MPVLNSLTFTLADQVWETTQTTGTGSYVLDGAKVNLGITYRTFLSGLGNGVRTGYTVAVGTSKEVGLGTISSPNTLSRDSILFSTNSNNAVSWSPGVKDIQCDISAALANQIWAKPGGGLPIGSVETRGPFVFSGSTPILDITGIASTARIMHLAWSGVQQGAADQSELILQLGDSGGIEQTGYASSLLTISSLGTFGQGNNTICFVLHTAGGGGSAQHWGAATLVRYSTGAWSYHSTDTKAAGAGNSTASASGAKALSAELDRVRITNISNINFAAGGNIALQIIHAF